MKIGITKEEARQLSALYKSQLSAIMEEWAEHSAAPSGGYSTDFGENWKLVSRRRNIWAQARQTYMFAATYPDVHLYRNNGCTK